MKNKRLIAVIALALMAVVLAGCVHMNVKLKINTDGSADYGFDMLASDTVVQMAQASGQDLWAQVTTQLQGEGYTVAAVPSRDGFGGISASRHFNDVSEMKPDSLGNAGGILGDTNTSFNVKTDKAFFGTTYTVNSTMDVSSLMPAADTLDALSAQMLKDVKVGLEVTLPVKADSSNATAVSADGLTYTWDIKLDQPNTIELAATVPNVKNILLVGGGAALVVIAAAAVIILLSVKAKKRKAAEAEMPPMPPIL